MRDFLKDNLALLSHKSPELCSLIKDATNDNQYNVAISKSGIATLVRVFPDVTKKALNSQYDPLHEATELVDANYSNEKSNYILDNDWDNIISLFPKAKLSTINNSGHWVHFDNPEEFYLNVMSFLK